MRTQSVSFYSEPTFADRRSQRAAWLSPRTLAPTLLVLGMIVIATALQPAAASVAYLGVDLRHSNRAIPVSESGAAANRPTDRPTNRKGIVRAIAQIKRQHGGDKIGLHWEGDRLLVPWVDSNGQRMLFEINPQTGTWEPREAIGPLPVQP